MQIEPTSLQDAERLTLTLRMLYEQYGYRAFTMNRMEEYAFYVENKNFLNVENIIVFSDLDGRLMALKPDITLSIVKNVKFDAEHLTKMYYAENVFRASKASREFRELRQMGLECIGSVTPYTVVEVLTLAAKTLQAVDGEYCLDVSHLGFVSGLMNSLKLDYALREQCLKCITEKNAHDLQKLALAGGVSAQDADRLAALVSIGGDLHTALGQAQSVAAGGEMQAALDELRLLESSMGATPLRIDFSILPDLSYYDGFVFNGYVKKAPDAVLKGGQYTNLLTRMGKAGMRAIGFALYFDELERYCFTPQTPRPDVFIRYDAATPPSLVRSTVEGWINRGRRVLADTSAPAQAPAERTVDLRGKAETK